jgi:hypothetical protein
VRWAERHSFFTSSFAACAALITSSAILPEIGL